METGSVLEATERNLNTACFSWKPVEFVSDGDSLTPFRLNSSALSGHKLVDHTRDVFITQSNLELEGCRLATYVHRRPIKCVRWPYTIDITSTPCVQTGLRFAFALQVQWFRENPKFLAQSQMRSKRTRLDQCTAERRRFSINEL